MDAISMRLKTLPDPITILRERLVIHHQTSPLAVEDFINCVREMKAELEEVGKGAVNEIGKGMDEGERKVRVEEGDLRKEGVLGY